MWEVWLLWIFGKNLRPHITHSISEYSWCIRNCKTLAGQQYYFPVKSVISPTKGSYRGLKYRMVLYIDWKSTKHPKKRQAVLYLQHKLFLLLALQNIRIMALFLDAELFQFKTYLIFNKNCRSSETENRNTRFCFVWNHGSRLWTVACSATERGENASLLILCMVLKIKYIMYRRQMIYFRFIAVNGVHCIKPFQNKR